MISSNDYYLCEPLADYAVDFMQCLPHPTDSFATSMNDPFIMQPWQLKIVREVFGTVSVITGKRRYRVLYIEIPRKNGKTTLAAAILTYLTFGDGEGGAQVISAALDQGQASLVYSKARYMINHTDLRQYAKENRTTQRIVNTLTDSQLYAVSRNAASLHGKDLHGAVCDEMHAWNRREMWDVITTAVASRSQPLIVITTTAGYDRTTICWELHQYALRVQAGDIVDPTFYPAVFGADTNDPWDQESTWRKANPNLGVSVNLEYLEQQARVAKVEVAHQNAFRRLHLNQWTQQSTRWLDMDQWALCS